MKLKDNVTCVINSLVVIGILLIFTGSLFDYYYELNDDVLLKDIVSGVYLGKPSIHNIYMQIPISSFLAFLYSMFPQMPWMGLILCVFQYLSLFAALLIAVSESRSRIHRAMIALAVSVFFCGILLPHYVLIQYTITPAIMVAAAIMVFYAIPFEVDDRIYFSHAITAIIFIIIAFWTRHTMVLLAMPFIAIAGIGRWSLEKEPFAWKNVRKYLITILILAGGLTLSYAVNQIGYSSDEWRNYLNENDARTDLYDYNKIPSYNENKGFYDSIGLDESDVALIFNYNYGLDDKIDASVLRSIVDYAEGIKSESTGEHVRKSLFTYFQEIINSENKEYSYIVLSLYLFLLYSIWRSEVKYKAYALMIRVGGLLFMRSLAWLFLIFRGRTPERVIHPLYMMEIALLAIMVLVENERNNLANRARYVMCVIWMSICISVFPGTYENLKEYTSQQDNIIQNAFLMNQYCREHAGNIYFGDVYSTVCMGQCTINEYIFKNYDNSYINLVSLGGWSVNSPIYREKLGKYEIKKLDEDILKFDNAFIICDHFTGLDWLQKYYDSKGINADIECIDIIAGSLGVYSIRTIL